MSRPGDSSQNSLLSRLQRQDLDLLRADGLRLDFCDWGIFRVLYWKRRQIHSLANLNRPWQLAWKIDHPSRYKKWQHSSKSWRWCQAVWLRILLSDVRVKRKKKDSSGHCVLDGTRARQKHEEGLRFSHRYLELWYPCYRACRRRPAKITGWLVRSNKEHP